MTEVLIVLGVWALPGIGFAVMEHIITSSLASGIIAATALVLGIWIGLEDNDLGTSLLGAAILALIGWLIMRSDPGTLVLFGGLNAIFVTYKVLKREAANTTWL